ncbi:MAG: BMP family ABC transporter substrate-binding protein [Mesotoga sp.]|jgi:basic membrane protein A|nr:BMP family ABC transporter substrate-binding protein [Mesotoga sp.]NLI06303.1 BMP family ABC transporter substrate-binding protein [Thermotogaceae bacterium]
MLAAPLKVAFVFVAPIGDGGWSFMHNQGRLYLEKVFGSDIVTDFIENVPEGAEAESVFRGYAQRGYDIVFGTSFGYMDSMVKVSKSFPKTTFMHCSGYQVTDNLGTYFGRMYEPRFLSGLVAGAMTKTNIIGYVAAFPIPEVIRGINAFAMGVQYVNPQAKVHVVWSNTWFDPAREKEAAVSLLDIGADVIAQHQDSPAPQQAAQDRGVYSIGYNSDMSAFAPKAFLAAPVWNWGPYYEKVVRSVMEGTWTNAQYWGGIKDGTVDIVLSDLVPSGVAKLVMSMRTAIIKGDMHPFVGPIYDQAGNLKYAEGEIPSDGDLLSMDWFINNVVGKIQ